MTDQEINIAIAKELGWTFVTRWIEYDGFPMPFTVWKLDGKDHNTIPDYCHDLNAMAQAECQVRHDFNDTHLKYLDILCSLCGSNREAFHATARQRAEAFLRVKGLWK